MIFRANHLQLLSGSEFVMNNNSHYLPNNNLTQHDQDELNEKYQVRNFFNLGYDYWNRTKIKIPINIIF